MLVQVLVVSHAIQLLAKSLQKQQRMAHMLGPLPPDWDGSPGCGLPQPRPQSWQPSYSEPAGGILYLSTSVTPISKEILKKLEVLKLRDVGGCKGGHCYELLEKQLEAPVSPFLSYIQTTHLSLLFFPSF